MIARVIRSWRARVAVEGASMRPALEPGDWLLVDPEAYATVAAGRGRPRARARPAHAIATAGETRGRGPRRRARAVRHRRRARRVDRLTRLRVGHHFDGAGPSLVPLLAPGPGGEVALSRPRSWSYSSSWSHGAHASREQGREQSSGVRHSDSPPVPSASSAKASVGLHSMGPATRVYGAMSMGPSLAMAVLADGPRGTLMGIGGLCGRALPLPHGSGPWWP